MLVRLHDLLAVPRAADSALCIDGARTLTWEIFLQRVGAATAALQASRASRWLLCLDDTFEFACGLFALMAAGKQVMIPANTREASRAELAGSYDAVLDDLEQLASSTAGACAMPLPRLDPAARISLYTSGSSGTPKEIRKTLAQFDAEVAALETCWGEAIGTATILASVPHHHIYGLLFRLFWPLAAGRPFARDTCGEAAQLRASLAAQADAVLVSSPAHLVRWPQLLELASLAPAPRLIFSSGAPLPAEAASAYAVALGHAPLEIFGSTESGGIAWRSQGEHGNPVWQPLPGVQVRVDADGALGVRSPHLDTPDWWRSDDAAELLESGGFVLRGRLDRTVKVQGKRVALPALEQLLAASPLVSAAAVVLLPGATEIPPEIPRDAPRTARERLGAVVVLSAAGIALLRESGRIGLVKQLRRHLSERYETVLLPRHWRFRAALPFDERGKLPSRALAALFVDESSAREPLLLSEVQDGNEVLLDLQVRHDLVYFAGHFPGLPILPGVVQVDWAARFVERYFPGLALFRSLDNLKFTAPVGPGAMLRLSLTHDPVQQRVQFVYRMQDRNCASGRLQYGGH